MIPLFKVYMSPDVDNFILPVLHSGYIGEGAITKRFEGELGKCILNENVVVVNSGTSAITMALKLADVGYGDIVISTPITCLATNMAILSVGAIPIWADVLHDGTLDPDDVKNKLKRIYLQRRLMPKAIICMDWGGTPCHLSELRCIANDYEILLIEDACQALGSKYCGMPIGNDADFVCFSFQAIKYLTTVDGGAVVINRNRDILMDKARKMRWFGLDRTKSVNMRCDQDPIMGYKWQLNDVLSSIGLANLITLSDRINLSKQHAFIYNQQFGYIPDFHRVSNYWLYTICIEDANNFIQYMLKNGVECSKVHDRNDKKTIFRESGAYLPGVDYFDSRHVCIPVGWHITDKDIEKIISLVKEYGIKQ